jgi:pimeloyl-ACP methyl ester carboxylesterase
MPSRSNRASAIRHVGGSGEPMVLLHGFALSADSWKPLLPHLFGHHSVHAGTYHGHHGGAPLPSNFRPSIASSVDLAATEMDIAGIRRAHLVGNSLGAWLALELARRGRALSVVAFSPGGGWESGSAEERYLHSLFKTKRRLLRVGGRIAPLVAASKHLRRFGLREIVANPDQLTHEQATLLIRTPGNCAAYDGVLRAMPHEPPPLPMDPLPCPVRIVWGTKDDLLPMKGYSERWRRLLPGAEWLELEGVGHVPMYDDPAACARAVLDFTQANPRQRESVAPVRGARAVNGSASATVSSRREPTLTSTTGHPESRSIRST